MPVAIKKKELLNALDNHRVTFIAEGDLTPEDVDGILRSAADKLADPTGKSDVNIDDLFPSEPTNLTFRNSKADIEATLKMNEEMRKVQREYRVRAALSARLARNLILDSNVRS